MTPEQIVKYFIWYCHNIMDYSQMSEFYGDPYPGYIDEKWMSFRKSYTTWFMDLDPVKQKEFMELAISHYKHGENDENLHKR